MWQNFFKRFVYFLISSHLFLPNVSINYIFQPYHFSLGDRAANRSGSLVAVEQPRHEHSLFGAGSIIIPIYRIADPRRPFKLLNSFGEASNRKFSSLILLAVANFLHEEPDKS